MPDPLSEPESTAETPHLGDPGAPFELPEDYPDFHDDVTHVMDSYAENRYTREYFAFLGELLNIKMLVGALHTLQKKIVDEDRQERSQWEKEVGDLVHAGRIDPSEADHLIHAMNQDNDRGFQELMHQFPSLQETQRNTLYCHVINTLENHFISVVKTITLAYPAQFVTDNISTSIKLSELLMFSTDKAAVWDHLLTNMVTKEDKRSSLTGSYNYLTNSRSRISAAETNLINGIFRAILVRHKLTHRAGLVDAAFLKERSTFPSSGESDPYAILGMQNVSAGGSYRVSEAELVLLIDAASKLALHFETQFHSLYPNICKYSAEDDHYNFTHIRELVDAWNRPESA